MVMRTKGSAAELEARRRRAAEFLRERMAPAEIARLVGASLSSVKRWKKALESEGEAARVGDIMVTTLRNPILTLVEDTTPGVHDTLIAACDKARYKGLGVVGYHDNCSDNLHNALLKVGRSLPLNTPDPLNLFMNIPVSEKGELAFEAPTSARGQFVRFKAEMDCIVAMSACPQDLVKVNDMKPVEVHFMVEE